MKPEGEGEEIGEENDQSGEKKCFWIFVAPIRTKLVFFWLPNSSLLFSSLRLTQFPLFVPQIFFLLFYSLGNRECRSNCSFGGVKKGMKERKEKDPVHWLIKKKRSTARVSSYRVTLYERSVCQAFQILLLDILYVREREREGERVLKRNGLVIDSKSSWFLFLFHFSSIGNLNMNWNRIYLERFVPDNKYNDSNNHYQFTFRKLRVVKRKIKR